MVLSIIRRSVFLLLLLATHFCLGQTPGGVVTNVNLWLKANAGVTGMAPVTQWNDFSGNAYHATATTGPDLQTNGLNYNPIVLFDGSSEFMQVIGGIYAGNTLNDRFVYIVNRTNANQNATAFRENLAAGKRFGVNVPWSDGNIYYDHGTCCTSSRVSTSMNNDQRFHITTLNASTSTATPNGTRKAIYIDGLLQASNNTIDNGTGVGNNFFIGSVDGTTEFHNGDIAELIVFDAIPTALQQQQIHSYLAIKYGIALDQSTAQDYLASNGSTIYAATTSHNGYLNDISGIGRDDNSALNQQKSMSYNLDAMVLMDKGGVFLNDRDYILWGNDDNPSIPVTSGAPPSFTYVIDRTWKADVSGTPGTVTVSFVLGNIVNTGNPADYALVIDNVDADFSAGATIHTTGATLVGDTIRFTAVSFTDGDHFSLATDAPLKAPGGVTMEIALWFKGNEGALGGAAIHTWEDKSGRRLDATQPTTAFQPNAATSVFNYNEVLSFDGSSTFLGLTDSIFALGDDDLGFYSVWHSETTTGWRRLASFGRSANTFGLGLQTSTISPLYGIQPELPPFTHGHLQPFAINERIQSTMFTQDYIVDDMEVGKNGSAFLTATSGVGGSASRDLQVGTNYIASRQDTTEHFFGKIGELIAYSNPQNAVDRAKIESYLSLKYSVTRENTGGGIFGDYTSSDATNIWDASLSPVYHNDVIGIARDEYSGFNQKQSHTQDDVTRIYLGTLVALNSDNTSSFSLDKSFLIAGHDTGQRCATVASNTEIPGTCGLYSRIEREWKLTKTNFGDNFNMDIALDACANLGAVTASDLRLLVDDDGDFSNGGTTCYFTGDGTGIVISYVSPYITISNISTTHIPDNTTRYITIASTNSDTPLPIELTEFSANCITGAAELNWTTSSESNNHYFLIQRSTDGTEFTTIAKVDGAGNSSEPMEYQYIDAQIPTSSKIYYRLTQVDFDGNQSDYHVRSLQCQSENSVIIYPNPTNGQFTLNSLKSGLMQIVDVSGKLIHEQNIKPGENLIETDGIAAGAYFVRVFLEDNSKEEIKLIQL